MRQVLRMWKEMCIVRCWGGHWACRESRLTPPPLPPPPIPPPLPPPSSASSESCVTEVSPSLQIHFLPLIGTFPVHKHGNNTSSSQTDLEMVSDGIVSFVFIYYYLLCIRKGNYLSCVMMIILPQPWRLRKKDEKCPTNPFYLRNTFWRMEMDL